MKMLLKVISYIGLALTVIPAFFVATGSLTLDTHKILMVIGMVLWFAASPFWMDKKTS
ncbi:hypothetical protein JW964_02085 [candidate division KSB1 bacterium]|nr:hypothetical protein [candidate division KSB1 bacterium]